MYKNSTPHCGEERRGRFSTALLLGIGVGVGIIMLMQPLLSPPAAHAQLPDSAAQRVEMLAEQKITNQKLTEIAALLREIRDQRTAPPKDVRPGEAPRK